MKRTFNVLREVIRDKRLGYIKIIDNLFDEQPESVVFSWIKLNN